MKSCFRYLSMAVAAGLPLVLASCGGGGGGGGGGTGGSPSGSGTATIQFANSAARSALAGVVTRAPGGNGGGPVNISEIESLTVTVTRIELQKCEDGEDDDDSPKIVHVKDHEFDPASITIERGDTVRWVWDTDTEHTVTSGAAGDPDAGSLFDASSSGTGSAVELTFADEGSFPYFSNTETDIDAGMAGVVNVEPEDEEDRAVAPRKHDDENDGEDDGDEGERLVVFEGATDVDLLDPIALSEALTTAEVPAGKYCGIRLNIENPRLVLKSDPETVITNVHLTANGRLFIKEEFEIQENMDVLILVDFGGMHLVKAGNSGKYVLTPQLKVDISVIDAHTTFTGEIVAVDADAQIIQVQTDTETIDVAVGPGTVISSDDDADDAADAGTPILLGFSDFEVGQTVSVDGLLTVAGPVNAGTIEIADEDVVTNDVTFTGTIVSVDTVNSVVQVQSGADTFDVAIGVGTVITTDDDADDAADTGATVTLAIGQLVAGQTVTVEGLTRTGLPIDGTAIEVADDSIATV